MVNTCDMKNLYRLILVVALFAMQTNSFALPPCQGSDASKWSNCYGSWTASDGNQYVGEWKNGTFNGQGTYIWTSGDKVAGEFKDGKTNGVVVRYFPDGNKYEGEEKDGLKHGQGILYFLADNQWKGQRYVGEHQGDKRNGLGVYYRADGSILEAGLYKDNTLVKSQYVDPSTFTRIAKSNSDPSGAEARRLENERLERQKGIGQPPCEGNDESKWSNCFANTTYQDGDKYIGDYKNGRRHGNGTYFSLADDQWKGDKYVGEFKDGKFSGQGTYYHLADNQWKGMKYVGEWNNDKKNGRGIDYKADGQISLSGLFNDGDFVSAQYVDPNSFTRIAKGSTTPSAAEALRLENERKAAQLEEDRKRIEEEKRQIALERQRIEALKGQALSSCQGNDATRWTNCFGTETFRNGDKSAAEYKDGKRTGQGVFTWADGDRYVGEFKDDKRNGRGIFYLANGSISQTGIWNDGTLASSQYVDPNSFTRIAKGNSAPSAAEAQRLENERKTAQLEEERRKFEEEKRQAALERQRIESQKAQTQVAPDNRRRLALVIGNDNYSSMPVLNNAVNDAKSMSDALKQANFEVLYYKNLNKRGMEEALYTFAQKLGKDDVGMFYFAGHGVQANSQNFLIPVAENVKKSADVQFEGIDVNRVMAYLRDSKNSLNIVVLDACRSSLPERGGMSRGLTVTEAPQGSIVAYATSPGKAASDGDGGNSPFTKNLIRVMQRKGVKIEDVFKEVRVAVARETNGEQVPQEVSQLVGDFYFRP